MRSKGQHPSLTHLVQKTEGVFGVRCGSAVRVAKQCVATTVQKGKHGKGQSSDVHNTNEECVERIARPLAVVALQPHVSSKPVLSLDVRAPEHAHDLQGNT